MATREEEQAVSTAIAGPARSNANATRPIAVFSEEPLTAYRLDAGSAVSLAASAKDRYSLLLIPA